MPSPAHVSRPEWIAVALGMLGGLAWVAKFLVMVGQGGPRSGSVPENLAFFLGLIALPVAAAALGWHLTRDRRTGLRVVAAVGGLIVFAGVQGIGQLLFTALPGDQWQQEEAIFVVLGLLAVLLAATALLRLRLP